MYIKFRFRRLKNSIEAVLTSNHDLCFGAKIKIGASVLLHTPVLLKVGFKGVYISRTCFLDGSNLCLSDMWGAKMNFSFKRRGVLTCTHNLYFEQKLEKCPKKFK